MLRITLDNPKSGWAFARLADGEKELVFTGSHIPTDAIRDLVEAVERLQTATSAGCCWSQEPGELHWKLRRTGSELELEILKFDGSTMGLQGSIGGNPSVFSKRMVNGLHSPDNC